MNYSSEMIKAFLRGLFILAVSWPLVFWAYAANYLHKNPPDLTWKGLEYIPEAWDVFSLFLHHVTNPIFFLLYALAIFFIRQLWSGARSREDMIRLVLRVFVSVLMILLGVYLSPLFSTQLPGTRLVI
jgi:hypothetical protein